MAIHITPTPLDGPLPGGEAGAKVVVEPIIAGEVKMPREAVEGFSGSSRFADLRFARQIMAGDTETYPCPCFLIRHPKAGPILVDTGLHPSVAADPRQSFGRILNWWLRPSLEPGQDIVSQLRRKGLDPQQIGTVIITHLHIDHAAAISELPDATFVVSEPEWESAVGPKPTPRGYRHQHFDHAFDFRTVSYDGPRINSYASFGRTFDLFGDGSIRLAFTPGHTAGHQSVICRLADHDFVIGGDAAYTRHQIEDESSPLPSGPEDEHNFKRSLREIRLFRSHYPNAVVTPGHDPAFYAEVAERYE
jgi:N-acyl homoserine lactone hydrolase